MKRTIFAACVMMGFFTAKAQENEGIKLPEWDKSIFEPGVETGRIEYRESYSAERVESRRIPNKQRGTRLAFDVAWAYRNVEPAGYLPRGFKSKMRSGISYGIDFHRFFHPWFGVGAKTSLNHFSYSKDGYGDKVNTYFIAPSFAMKMFETYDSYAYFGLAVGYIRYNENLRYPGERERIRKNGVKSSFDFGYDFRVANRTFLGFKISLVLDSVTDVSYAVYYDHFGEYYYDSGLGAIELGLGLRF